LKDHALLECSPFKIAVMAIVFPTQAWAEQLLLPERAEALPSELDNLPERPDPDRPYLHDICKIYAKPPKYTSESIRTDKELVLRILSQHKEGWRLIRNAAPELQADREVVLAAVRGSPSGWRALAYTTKELCADRDLALEAVRSNAAAMEYVSPELRTDRELISEAMSAITRNIRGKSLKMNKSDWDRIFKGHTSLDQQSHKADWGSQKQDPRGARLHEEVRDGQSHLYQDEEGNFLRGVQIACVRLKQHDGLILARVGKYEDGVLEAKCCLPGLKTQQGEHPFHAAQRLIQSDLACLAKVVKVYGEYQDIFEDVSSQYGVQSKYMRTVLKAKLTSTAPWLRSCRRLYVTSTHASIRNARLSRRFGTNRATPLAPDVFVLPSDVGSQRKILYSWLPPWEYDWLQQSDTGKELLQEWLDEVIIDEQPAGASGPCTMSSGFARRSSYSPERRSSSEARRPNTSPNETRPTDTLRLPPTPRPNTTPAQTPRGFSTANPGKGTAQAIVGWRRGWCKTPIRESQSSKLASRNSKLAPVPLQSSMH